MGYQTGKGAAALYNKIQEEEPTSPHSTNQGSDNSANAPTEDQQLFYDEYQSASQANKIKIKDHFRSYARIGEATATAMLKDERVMKSVKIRIGRNDGGVFNLKKLETTAIERERRVISAISYK